MYASPQPSGRKGDAEMVPVEDCLSACSDIRGILQAAALRMGSPAPGHLQSSPLHCPGRGEYDPITLRRKLEAAETQAHSMRDEAARAEKTQLEMQSLRIELEEQRRSTQAERLALNQEAAAREQHARAEAQQALNVESSLRAQLAAARLDGAASGRSVLKLEDELATRRAEVSRAHADAAAVLERKDAHAAAASQRLAGVEAEARTAQKRLRCEVDEALATAEQARKRRAEACADAAASAETTRAEFEERLATEAAKAAEQASAHAASAQRMRGEFEERLAAETAKAVDQAAGFRSELSGAQADLATGRAKAEEELQEARATADNALEQRSAAEAAMISNGEALCAEVAEAQMKAECTEKRRVEADVLATAAQEYLETRMLRDSAHSSDVAASLRSELAQARAQVAAVRAETDHALSSAQASLKELEADFAAAKEQHAAEIENRDKAIRSETDSILRSDAARTAAEAALEEVEAAWERHAEDSAATVEEVRAEAQAQVDSIRAACERSGVLEREQHSSSAPAQPFMQQLRTPWRRQRKRSRFSTGGTLVEEQSHRRRTEEPSEPEPFQHDMARQLETASLNEEELRSEIAAANADAEAAERRRAEAIASAEEARATLEARCERESMQAAGVAEALRRKLSDVQFQCNALRADTQVASRHAQEEAKQAAAVRLQLKNAEISTAARQKNRDAALRDARASATVVLEQKAELKAALEVARAALDAEHAHRSEQATSIRSARELEARLAAECSDAGSEVNALRSRLSDSHDRFLSELSAANAESSGLHSQLSESRIHLTSELSDAGAQTRLLRSQLASLHVKLGSELADAQVEATSLRTEFTDVRNRFVAELEDANQEASTSRAHLTGVQSAARAAILNAEEREAASEASLHLAQGVVSQGMARHLADAAGREESLRQRVAAALDEQGREASVHAEAIGKLEALTARTAREKENEVSALRAQLAKKSEMSFAAEELLASAQAALKTTEVALCEERAARLADAARFESMRIQADWRMDAELTSLREEAHARQASEESAAREAALRMEAVELRSTLTDECEMSTMQVRLLGAERAAEAAKHRATKLDTAFGEACEQLEKATAEVESLRPEVESLRRGAAQAPCEKMATTPAKRRRSSTPGSGCRASSPFGGGSPLGASARRPWKRLSTNVSQSPGCAVRNSPVLQSRSAKRQSRSSIGCADGECWTYRRTGSCRKGDRCQWRHTRLASHTVIPDSLCVKEEDLHCD